jgi:arylsulfatase A-like enzyme
MKGRKGSTDEGGVRVPCLMRWPGHVKPGTRISQIAGAIDLLPTFADIAGIPIVGSKRLDGISIKPLILGTAKKWPDRMIFSHQKGRVSVRTQQYRLDHTGKLFDMTTDPGQYHDISREKPEGRGGAVEGGCPVEAGGAAHITKGRPALPCWLPRISLHGPSGTRWSSLGKRSTKRQST